VIAVIGIDDYIEWPRLGNARSDAMGVQQVFLQLGFVEVTPPLLDRAATGEAMHRLVADDLRTRLSPDDSLVLFIAGHGRTETTPLGDKLLKTGYAIPVDAALSEDRPRGACRAPARRPGHGRGLSQASRRDHVLEPAPMCGDGHVDAGEQCDDGNPISGDGCSSTCRLEPVAPEPVLPPAPATTRKGRGSSPD
jgi:cysteine-rich repeat protein